jgi:hypothetical protein
MHRPTGLYGGGIALCYLVIMEPTKSKDDSPPEEIAHRRDELIRRALGTPAKPMSDYVGKSERAKARKKKRRETNESRK